MQKPHSLNLEDMSSHYAWTDEKIINFSNRFATGKAFEISSFYADHGYPEPTRCDLHPNWSRDGRKVCIDSIHEHSRQMYVIDVSSIVQ